MGDIDFEPLTASPIVSTFIQQLGVVLGADALVIAMINSAWLGMLDFLKEYAALMDFLTTIYCTPYPGFDKQFV